MYEPASILVVRVTEAVISTFESALATDLTTVPVQVFGVSVCSEVAEVAISTSRTSLL